MNIHIPDDCKVAHVLFSGGIDSTLILYLLAMQKRSDITIKCYSMSMSKNTKKYLRCQNIIKYIENKFNIKILHFATYQVFFIRNFVKQILEIEDGYVFSGCNKVLLGLNPTNYIQDDTPPIRGPALNDKHLRPFIDIDKSKIIKAFVELNIVNLFNLTYSCGYSHKNPCGSCYFCLEREWGILHMHLDNINNE